MLNLLPNTYLIIMSYKFEQNKKLSLINDV